MIARLPWDVDLDTQVSEATLNRLGKEYNQTKYEYTSPDGKTRRQYLLDVNPMIWERVRGDGMNVIDARWIDVRNGLFIDITGLSVTNPVSYPGVWSCKNNHMYKTIELYPMRETTFEGTLAKVPYAYDQILTDEYRASALVNTNFNGHNWDPKRKEWVKSSEFLKGEQENKRREESDNEKSQLERMRLA
ncbi:LicD family-domain-containing protein [Phaeosphaeriaceae sp. PMI808]|nr:LicD family-domain-containing protein [Phaeosphaeriaceae sp. PMI808]